ncbi:MAG: hypothetical protein E7167_03030 [Firmicutes bacterium]|nr:hypothetical protein [Bacillota bacterium]
MKITKKIALVLIMFFLGVTMVSAHEMGLNLAINTGNVVCHDVGVLKAMRIIAIVIIVIKVMVPVLLIIMGIKDLAKAVIEGDDGDIKKFFPLFLARFCTGVFVFFIPTIVYAILSVAQGYDTTKAKFTDCGKCLTSISSCNNLISKYSK